MGHEGYDDRAWPERAWHHKGSGNFMQTGQGDGTQPALGYKPLYVTPEGVTLWGFDDDTWLHDVGVERTTDDVTVRGFDEATWLGRHGIEQPDEPPQDPGQPGPGI